MHIKAAEHRRTPNVAVIGNVTYALASWTAAAPCRFYSKNPTAAFSDLRCSPSL
jgi:hypothetical protein